MASEAAIKYFLMGAFVSAFVLYGIALVYGATGSTRFEAIGRRPRRRSRTPSPRQPRLPAAGRRLRLQDEPRPLPRLVAGHLPGRARRRSWPSSRWRRRWRARWCSTGCSTPSCRAAAARAPASGRTVVAILAVLSMVVGNLLALVQRDIKRMLAYSGIAHMGYLLLALVTLDRASLMPVLVYLLAYVLMNAGAFTVVSLLYSRPGEQHLISDLARLGLPLSRCSAAASPSACCRWAASRRPLGLPRQVRGVPQRRGRRPRRPRHGRRRWPASSASSTTCGSSTTST